MKSIKYLLENLQISSTYLSLISIFKVTHIKLLHFFNKNIQIQKMIEMQSTNYFYVQLKSIAYKSKKPIQ
jgi:hypothetical protein